MVDGASCPGRISAERRRLVKVAVIGAGAVGARAARQLASTEGVSSLTIHDPVAATAESVVKALDDERATVGKGEEPEPDIAIAILAGPVDTHVEVAAKLIDAGTHVVSVSDSIEEVRDLLALDWKAAERGVTVAVGAGFAPGLTCLLAAHAAATFDVVDEIHVAKAGTGGPACARQHHHALGGVAVDWRDGAWSERPGGSGRELCWFPDPVGPQDCYRAALPDSVLLVPAFPHAQRITIRMAANRRDRLTSHLPMLRKPHPEGGPGAVRVEVRGTRAGARVVQVLGAMDRPALAAGAVAALTAVAIVNGEAKRVGSGGLAQLFEPVGLLTELARRGIKAAVFEGANA